MTTNTMIAMYSDFKSAMAKVAEADKYAKTFEGAYTIIVKLWDKGYKDAAVTLLGEKFSKPSALKKYVVALRRGDAASALYVLDDKGKRTLEKGSKKDYVLGLWKTVKVVDEDVTIKGRDGKDTHPYKTDKNGEVITREELKAVRSWTPKAIFEVIMQDLAYSASERALEELSNKYCA